MSYDGIVTAAVAAELNDKLYDGRIARVSQPEEDEIILTVKSRQGTFRLLLSASASLPLVHLTEQNPPSPLTAPNFCMLLRKQIGNAHILRISQPGLERVISIEMEHYDEMGDLKKCVLNTEIMGKYSNIILVSEAGTIVDSIRHVSSSMSSVREVLPGRRYFIPNTQEKKNPLSADRDGVCAVLCGEAPAASALSSSFTGISRVSAGEIVTRAGVDPDARCSALSDREKEKTADAFLQVMEDVQEGRFFPCTAVKDGQPVEFAAIRLTGWTDCTLVPGDSISTVIEHFYAERAQAARMREKSTTLRRQVSNLIERSAKKLDLQEKQLKDTEKRDRYRLYGELLNTYGYDIPAGSREAVVNNYYTGQDVRIPLDATLTPVENAQKYFDRYGKLKRTNEALTGLTVQTAEELDHLRSVSASIDLAESEADLSDIRRELTECGYLRPERQGKRRKPAPRRNPPYHFRSSDGFDIYVGRNNLQNDELTFHFAQGNDIWMHIKKAHGSHVIIQTGGRDVPDRTYEEAGALAVRYSEARATGRGEVDYIQRKFVKKPAGAKPGFVIYHTNYSLMADAGLVKDWMPVD